MKKIINGKKYNTNTAKEIAHASANCDPSDFEFWRETLYKKKTGEFFLHGEGQGNSKYASHYGNSRGAGEEIIPMDENEAREWTIKKLNYNNYKPTIQQNQKIKTSIRIIFFISENPQLFATARFTPVG